jgi:hypothetical protein
MASSSAAVRKDVGSMAPVVRALREKLGNDAMGDTRLLSMRQVDDGRMRCWR